jgi:hypothetical protein
VSSTTKPSCRPAERQPLGERRKGCSSRPPK